MIPVEAEARCRALVAALWTHHAIVAAEEDGRAIVRIMATVPPLRGMTVVAEVRRVSVGRAWRAAWPILVDRAHRETMQLAVNAANHEAAARAALANRATIMGIIDGTGGLS